MEWFDKYCLSFAKRKFNSFHLDSRVKARTDYEDLVNKIRLTWWLKVLPIYAVLKVKSLEIWTCYCIRKMVITYFGSFKTLRKTQLRMLSLYDITNKYPDGKERDTWINDHRDKLNKDKVNAENKVNEIVEALSPPVLTPKEFKILQDVIHCYRTRPDMIRGLGVIPTDKIAKHLRIDPKSIDNGMQRIRRKMRGLGLL
jgi:hypothetical protein